MNLENYTDEQLREELEKRNAMPHNEGIQDPQHLMIGIIDDEGVDSMVYCETNKKFAETLKSLQLKSRFNGQRNPIIYSVKVPKRMFEVMNEGMRKGENQKIASVIKGLSNFTKIG